MNDVEPVRWVTIGRVVGAFGVRGELRIRALTEKPKAILDHTIWWLQHESGRRQEIRLLSGRDTPKGVVVKLEGVKDRNQVDAYVGAEIQIPRTMLAQADGSDEDGLWADLIGCRVEEKSGNSLGTVAEMMATGANDVMIVRGGPDGEKLIPYTKEVIDNVDLENHCIKVTLLEGM
uniref:Ribosome maturation factor RimM n=1 Tax=Magnetococcus massalia (strain MO-1) TaxID=451514 RepID=A0A1S7LMQ6_MAGMO|nr:Ribosome maturation factor rimM [Candidatus Magnetococcus massalia]